MWTLSGGEGAVGSGAIQGSVLEEAHTSAEKVRSLYPKKPAYKQKFLLHRKRLLAREQTWSERVLPSSCVSHFWWPVTWEDPETLISRPEVSIALLECLQAC